MLVAKIYTNNQVAFFSHKILNIQLALDTDPDKYTWTEITKIVYQYWLAMDSVWIPAGKTLNGSTKQNFESLQQNYHIFKLQLKQVQKSGSQTQTQSRGTICFDCGQKNIKQDHNGCPNKNKTLFLPDRVKKMREKKKKQKEQSQNIDHSINEKKQKIKNIFLL